MPFIGWVFSLVVAAFVAWVIYSYMSIRGIEEDAYVVQEYHPEYQIRRYDPSIVASVETTGPYSRALSDGFRIIAAYIFGNNTSRTALASYVPKEHERPPERIAMTAPVLETSDRDRHTVSFVMPRTYSLETLPFPNDSRIRITARPARTVAALRFSGLLDYRTVAAKKARLTELLKRDGIEPKGEPEAAFYNPPWTVPFMRRNEVLVEI